LTITDERWIDHNQFMCSEGAGWFLVEGPLHKRLELCNPYHERIIRMPLRDGTLIDWEWVSWAGEGILGVYRLPTGELPTREQMV